MDNIFVDCRALGPVKVPSCLKKGLSTSSGPAFLGNTFLRCYAPKG